MTAAEYPRVTVDDSPVPMPASRLRRHNDGSDRSCGPSRSAAKVLGVVLTPGPSPAELPGAISAAGRSAGEGCPKDPVRTRIRAMTPPNRLGTPTVATLLR